MALLRKKTLTKGFMAEEEVFKEHVQTVVLERTNRTELTMVTTYNCRVAKSAFN